MHESFRSSLCILLALVIIIPEGFVNAQLRKSTHEMSNPNSAVACFFESWSVLRPGMKQFSVDFIDPNLCTHVIFGFASLHEHTLTISHPRESVDAEGLFQELVSLKRKSPSLSVTVAVGGWTEGSHRFTRMVSSFTRRKAFIDSVLIYLRRHELDGLDIMWQSPADRGGVPSDKENLVKLCQELKEALKPRGYRLTIGVMSSKRVIDNGYDLAGLAQHVDAVYLLAYDYHGKWERKTGLNAPLYPRTGETARDLTKNVNFTVSYLIQKGVPPQKLILGLPMFGRGFFLADPANRHLGANSLDGEFSSGDGFLAYNEICEKFVTEGIRWSVRRHSEQQVPYAYREHAWISYDDSLSLSTKVSFAKRLKLGGVFAFALSTDDFRGQCGLGKYPLLTAVNQEMRKGGPIPHGRHPVVACFLQGWSVYRPSLGRFTAGDIDTSLCTHVILSFAGLDESNLTIVDLDPNYSTNGIYRDLFRLKWKNPSLVTTVAVGGYDEGSMKFSRMVSSRPTRKVFIESVLKFLQDTMLDGIDLVWYDPTYRGSPLVDRENFVLLCQEMSAAFADGGYHLGVTVSGRSDTLRQGYDLPSIGQAADLVYVILYDFFGPWDGRTSHTSPLYPRAGDNSVQSTYNMDSGIRYVLEAGVPVEKVVASIPFYSRTYTLQNPSNSGYGVPSSGDGLGGPYTKVVGFMGYNEICEMQRNEPEQWTTHWEPQHQVNYMHNKRFWLAFDNTTTVEERVRLALRHGVTGVGVWAVDMDDFHGNCGNEAFPLLKAVNRVLRTSFETSTPVVVPDEVPVPESDIGCTVAPATDVVVEVLLCGGQKNGTCAVEDIVPPDTVVLAECWKTSYMVMRCNKDGFWRSYEKNDDTAEGKVAVLCQPYYLNSQVCGRRPRYEKTGPGTLDLLNFTKQENRWPWMAELLHDNAYVCTGTLINPVYVLTAAHCVSRSQESSTMPIELSRLVVEIGMTTTRTVKEVRIHPAYETGSSPQNDIALIRLDYPLVFHSRLYPACVADAELNPFQEAVVFNRKEAPENGLRYDLTLLQASPDCLLAQVNCPGRLQIQPSQFCAISSELDPQVLTGGSSGGPFLQDLAAGDVTEAWTVTGVTSSSSKTVDCEVPVFTDVFPFLDWLRDSVAALMNEHF
ncbi:Serine proteases trypsin domain [Trinorchestia longiramus]|nr:Serine proteases trypsin domain [Trinorchestia longiramus]